MLTPLQSGAREHDSRRERRRSRSRSPAARERGRERGHRERSPSPPRRGHAPRSPPRENEPIRLSRELAQLMSQLPPPHMRECGVVCGVVWQHGARELQGLVLDSCSPKPPPCFH